MVTTIVFFLSLKASIMFLLLLIEVLINKISDKQNYKRINFVLKFVLIYGLIACILWSCLFYLLH